MGLSATRRWTAGSTAAKNTDRRGSRFRIDPKSDGCSKAAAVCVAKLLHFQQAFGAMLRVEDSILRLGCAINNALALYVRRNTRCTLGEVFGEEELAGMRDMPA